MTDTTIEASTTDEPSTPPAPDADPAPGVSPEPAPPAPEPDAPASEPEAAKERRSKGGLEVSVKQVCDDFVVGNITLKEDELLTPHKISRLIKDRESLGEAPSTGAVAACLARWSDIGFATLNGKPVAFVDYTEAGRTEGLSALKAAAAERKRAARKAEKAAAAPAASPAPATPPTGEADGSFPTTEG